MPSPNFPVLQQLDRLDRPSSGFHDQLRNILYGEKYKQCVPGLQGDDLVWLVYYLDVVRCRVNLSRPPLKSM
jgi:tRNA (Thr-GGU) A37 N-methylase